jgi:hypothetical protein
VRSEELGVRRVVKRCALNRFWILIRRFHGDSITVYALWGSIVSTCRAAQGSHEHLSLIIGQ